MFTFVSEICFVYTDDDKPEMTMPKQIDVRVTKPQNKHGHGRNRKCSIHSNLFVRKMYLYPI